MNKKETEQSPEGNWLPGDIPLEIVHHPIFSSTVRLTIMMILNANSRAEFTKLRKLLKLTPGNMDHHVRVLEQADYLQKSKSFYFKRPMTVLLITDKGTTEFKTYADHLSRLLNQT